MPLSQLSSGSRHLNGSSAVSERRQRRTLLLLLLSAPAPMNQDQMSFLVVKGYKSMTKKREGNEPGALRRAGRVQLEHEATNDWASYMRHEKKSNGLVCTVSLEQHLSTKSRRKTHPFCDSKHRVCVIPVLGRNHRPNGQLYGGDVLPCTDGHFEM